MSLQLVPNEIVGYRIRPDTYSFNVVVVKRYGEGSKSAGQEYDTPVAYCKNLTSAATWLLSYVLRISGEGEQKAVEAKAGVVADTAALIRAMATAEQRVLEAVQELEARIKSSGLTLKDLNKSMNDA
ncbi:hypothetical protein LC612_33825 [Nostoc sp. CHAB 5834]|nr:hypothetical protein [Nostoc sp. CHAB 5834]